MTCGGPRIPVATYRLQFNARFGFRDATALVPYLHRLGVSDLYASPYFKAHPGSLHGYDILDQNALNPEVGSEEEHAALCAELAGHGMGQILDIVPNHMCIEGQGNALWMDVLENGPSSACAGFFDIDWHPAKRELDNKVLIPILGDQYGTVLENGELSLRFETGSFFIYYYEHKLPILPKSYHSILTLRLDELERELEAAPEQFQELMSIVTALKHLPPSTEQDPQLIEERYREKEIVKRRLWGLYQASEAVGRFVDANVATYNGCKGDPRSFDLLDTLLREQVYRISYWRVATEEINYRRFFDINSLAAIRVEDPVVFERTHRLIFSLVAAGKVTGLRVDHADGLLDPEDYLKRLQAGCHLQLHPGGAGTDGAATDGAAQTDRAGGATGTGTCGASPLGGSGGATGTGPFGASPLGGADAKPPRPFFIVAEKILSRGEKLPEGWPVFNATGYDFANQVNGLFVETRNAQAFETIYSRFLKRRIDVQDTVYQKKKLVMQAAMSSEINMLGHFLSRISELNRHTRDFTLNSLIKSIVEVIACFPVYRTYIRGFEVSERDRQYVESAVGRAKRLNPAVSASVFDFIRDVLALRLPESLPEEHRLKCLDFAMRFQQITGPVMAKGVEDTAFYVYNRLVSLNEVGGNPERFGITPEIFHGQNIERLKSRPLALLASSTHDTKRSEDVRARINVLSEIPERWRAGLTRWSRLNRRVKEVVDDRPTPTRNEEYLLYQTLVGTWPFCRADEVEFGEFRGRIREYMLKAMREAKAHTSWISMNERHEAAALSFIDRILADSGPGCFLRDFAAFQELTAACGMLNSLSQTLIKIASPGIPDFYQGNELWDFSLVDPDNRRPVDFDLRREALERLQRREAEEGSLAVAREVVHNRRDGRIKMYLTYKALNLRRERRALFESGRYLPLAVEGARQEQVCAFERSLGDSSVLVVAPRFCTRLIQNPDGLPLGAEVWQDTRVLLPGAAAGTYRNVLTGETLRVDRGAVAPSLDLGDLLSAFPVALLLAEGTEGGKTKPGRPEEEGRHV